LKIAVLELKIIKNFKNQEVPFKIAIFLLNLQNNNFYILITYEFYNE